MSPEAFTSRNLSRGVDMGVVAAESRFLSLEEAVLVDSDYTVPDPILIEGDPILQFSEKQKQLLEERAAEFNRSQELKEAAEKKRLRELRREMVKARRKKPRIKRHKDAGKKIETRGGDRYVVGPDGSVRRADAKKLSKKARRRAKRSG